MRTYTADSLWHSLVNSYGCGERQTFNLINKTMRHFYRVVACVMVTLATLSSCSYDDDNLWNEVENIKNRLTTLEEAVIKTNDDIVALQSIVNALQKCVYVTSVTPIAGGYTITFSDDTTATIANGKDGANGTNAPVISVKRDTDGNYYWTMDGEWLMVDGERVRTNGIDGEDGTNGKDAVAPQVRINDTTKEWEISTDGGQTWTSTGVVAEGKDGADGSNGSAGDSLFRSVDTSNPDYVIITLADGTEFRLARYDESAPVFIIVDAPALAEVEYGTTIEFVVDADNIANYVVTTPEGWKASFADGMLNITAPAKDLCHFDKEGCVAITVVSEQGKSTIVKLNVIAGEWVDEVTLRTLTFEDADAKFTPYHLEYVGKDINTWSDLIAADQYGDYILGYGAWMGECVPTEESHYCWYDENNTFLAHDYPYNYYSYCFAGGGHAISNYASSDYSSHGDYTYQLTVYDKDAGGLVTTGGGHNGSDNFAMHYGYFDGSDYNQTTEDALPAIFFKDEQARVIDHVWVTLSTYEYYCLYEGNGLTAPLGEGDYVIIEAIGHKEDGTTKKVSLRVADLENGVIDDWTKWDLTSLGKVKRVHFNIIGTNDNGYGFSQPAYFAYDDVAVQFIDKVFK